MDPDGTLFMLDARTGQLLNSFKTGQTTGCGPSVVDGHVYVGSGYVNFGLGLQGFQLHALGLWQMERIYRRWKGVEAEEEAWIAPFAAALQMGALVYLVGATFQGIGYQPVMLMLVGLQIGLNTYCTRIDSARALHQRSEQRRAAIDDKLRGAVAA